MKSVSRQSSENSVGRMFDRIAPVYDRLNHILSFGMDFSWRHRITHLIDNEKKLRILDLASGSGDLLISILKSNPNITEAIGLDISENMLAISQKKIARHNLSGKVKLICADADSTGLSDNAFDYVTMGFGIRNTPDASKTLSEIFRLLKSGGTALILEFSIPSNRLLKYVYLLYLRLIVPFIGRLVSGDKDAYKYLDTSIEQFCRTKDLNLLIREAGFENVIVLPLTFGIVSIYIGSKIH